MNESAAIANNENLDTGNNILLENGEISSVTFKTYRMDRVQFSSEGKVKSTIRFGTLFSDKK